MGEERTNEGGGKGQRGKCRHVPQIVPFSLITMSVFKNCFLINTVKKRNSS